MMSFPSNQDDDSKWYMMNDDLNEYIISHHISFPKITNKKVTWNFSRLSIASFGAISADQSSNGIVATSRIQLIPEFHWFLVWYSHSWYCWYVPSWYDTPISCIFLSWYCSHSWYVWGYSWDSSWLVSILPRWSTECPKSRFERRHSICPYLEGGIGTNKLVKFGEDNRSIDGYPLENHHF